VEDALFDEIDPERFRAERGIHANRVADEQIDVLADRAAPDRQGGGGLCLVAVEEEARERGIGKEPASRLEHIRGRTGAARQRKQVDGWRLRGTGWARLGRFLFETAAHRADEVAHLKRLGEELDAKLGLELRDEPGILIDRAHHDERASARMWIAADGSA